MRKITLILVFLIITSCATNKEVELKYTEKGYSYHTKPFNIDTKENSV